MNQFSQDPRRAGAEAPGGIDPYIAIVEQGTPALSGDGGLLAWLSNAAGHAQIRLRDLADPGALDRLVATPEPVGKLVFRPGSRDLLFTMDRGGDERHQLWLLPEGAPAPRPLTEAPRVVHLFGAFSPDGARLAYAANPRDPGAMDVFVMELATGAARCVHRGEGYTEVLAFFRNGNALLLRQSRASSDQRLLRLDLDSGALEPLLSTPGPTEYRSAKTTRDGAALLLLCDAGRDRHAVHRFDLAGGTLELLADCLPGEVEAFALSPDEARLALVVNAEGFSRVELVELASGERRRLPVPAPGVISALAFEAGGDGLIFGFEGAATPPGIWRQPLDGSPASPLAAAPVPPALPDFAEPQLACYPSFDGREIPCLIYQPPGPKPAAGWPVLVIVHGGPELQWRPTFRPDIQWMLARGIRVVAPNVRGSTGYGRAFHALDDREKRMDSVADLRALRDRLAADPQNDATRIGVFGRSYGGFMVLAALTDAPADWRLGIDFYGIANFATMMQTTGPWRRGLRAAEYGDPATMGAELEAFSPIHRIERIVAPLLLVHAFEDPRVPIGESEMVHSCLRGLGREVEYLRIAHEGHGFARSENRQRVFGTVARFLERFL